MKNLFILFTSLVTGILFGSAFSANTLSAGGHKGIVRSQSADPLGLHAFQLGGALQYGQEMEYIHSIEPYHDRYGSPRIVSGVGFIGFGLFSVLDLGINLPAYYENPQYGSTKPKGVGDLEVSMKLTDFWMKSEERVFTNALYMAFQFPTGDFSEGFFPRHAYYGDMGNWSSENVLFLPMIISTIHFDRMKNKAPLLLNINFGGIFNAPNDNNALNASLGFACSPNDVLTLFIEISAEERFKTVNNDNNEFFSDLINDPIFVTPGLKITIPKANLSMTLAGDIGISSSDKQVGQLSHAEDGTTVLHQANPLYNGYFALSFTIPGTPKDQDNDGIVGKTDQCPEQAEDKDGFKDDDGCPDYDNDADGIADSLDKCPDLAGIAENSGCPDIDTDNDGIVDRLDKCPDKAGIPELNGCPDVDSDHDGIVDRLDKCPNDAEDFDNFQDFDGCPDYDNDGDGFPDLADNCPNTPGVAENGGCPKTKEIPRGQLVLKGVNFESGKDVLLAGSYSILDDIAESLREWIEVRVEIQGHCDNAGNDEKNLELSRRRAETVRQYLIQKGVTSDRLTSIGYGEERPIADNKTASGRAQNRRVELKRLD